MPIRQKILTVAVVLALTVFLAGCQIVQPHSTTTSGIDPAASDVAHVAEFIRVVDGDTIAIVPSDQLPATNDRGDEHYVRVLGIDAPEMNKMDDAPAECGAQDASDHLAAFLAGQQVVSLVFDPVSDRTDRFGRSLAYVELTGENPIDLGHEQVRAGFAEAWYPRSEPEPSRYASYRETQQAASAAGAGAFGACDNVGR